MPHELETLEDAILEALEPLRTAGTIRTLEPYAGQFDQSLGDVTARAPAIYVACYDLTVDAHNRVDLVTASPRLYTADRNFRGPGQSGVWSILAAARARLNAVRLAGWSALSWQSDQALLIGPRNSISISETTYRARRPLTRS